MVNNIISGLHIKLGCGKGQARGLPFSTARPRPSPQPASPPLCAVRRPALLSSTSVQPAENFHLETRLSSPPGPPALQLVLSPDLSQYTQWTGAHFVKI